MRPEPICPTSDDRRTAHTKIRVAEVRGRSRWWQMVQQLLTQPVGSCNMGCPNSAKCKNSSKDGRASRQPATPTRVVFRIKQDNVLCYLRPVSDCELQEIRMPSHPITPFAGYSFTYAHWSDTKLGPTPSYATVRTVLSWVFVTTLELSPDIQVAQDVLLLTWINNLIWECKVQSIKQYGWPWTRASN